MTVPAVSGWIVAGGGSGGSVMHGTGIASARVGGKLASGIAAGKINAVRSSMK